MRLPKASRPTATRDREVGIAAIKRRLTDARSRLVALVLATDMAAADGVVHEAERKLVLETAREFDVPEEEARALLDDAPGQPRSPYMFLARGRRGACDHRSAYCTQRRLRRPPRSLGRLQVTDRLRGTLVATGRCLTRR